MFAIRSYCLFPLLGCVALISSPANAQAWVQRAQKAKADAAPAPQAAPAQSLPMAPVSFGVPPYTNYAPRAPQPNHNGPAEDRVPPSVYGASWGAEYWTANNVRYPDSPAPPPAEYLAQVQAPPPRATRGAPEPIGKPEPLTHPLAPPEKGNCLLECETAVPCWQVTAEVLGLTREPANDHLIIYQSECDNPKLDAGQLDFGYDLGVRVSIARSDCTEGGWEFAYLGLPNWQARETVAGNLYFCGLGFSLLACPALFSAEYESNLHSFEVNFRPGDCMACNSRCSWFAGFRYIRLDETLRLSELNAPLYDVFTVSTGNNLYGVQFGNSYLLYDQGGPLYIESLMKLGVFANDSDQHTLSHIIGPPASAGRTALAYAGEFAIAAGYRIRSCLDVRAGYQLLGMGAVALAPDQLAATDLVAHTAGMRYSTLLAHGGFIGLTFRW